MLRLVGTELRRLVSRRFFRLLLLASALGIFAGGVANFVTSSTGDARSRAAAQRALDRCERERTDFLRSARESGEGRAGFRCPSLAEVQPTVDKQYRYADEVVPTTRGVAVVGVVLGFLVGASAVGAEWGTGGMTTFVTWEPRRARVLGAKAFAAFVAVGVVAFALLAFLALVFLPSGLFRGTMTGAGAELWRELSGSWGRGAALAGIGALFGVAVATLTRNTAGAVGTGAVFMSIVDPIASSWRGRRFAPWLFQQNIAQFLGFPVPSSRVAESGALSGADPFRQFVLPPWRPALLLSAYACALLLASYIAFRVRDVT